MKSETLTDDRSHAEDPDVIPPFYHICEGNRVLLGPLGRKKIVRGFLNVYEKQGYDVSIRESELPYALYCRICGAQLTKESAHPMVNETGETIATYCGQCAEIERPHSSSGRLSGYLVSCPWCEAENVAHRSDEGIECEDCEAFFDPKKQWEKR